MASAVACSSYYKMRYWENADLLGNDMSTTTVSTVENCMDLCIANNACNAFTYDLKNRLDSINCWLKTEASVYYTDSDREGYVSGTRCSAAINEEPLSSPSQYPEGSFKIVRSTRGYCYKYQYLLDILDILDKLDKLYICKY